MKASLKFAYSVIRNAVLRDGLKFPIFRVAGMGLRVLLSLSEKRQFNKIFGDFSPSVTSTKHNVENESGIICGPALSMVENLDLVGKRVLLTAETEDACQFMQNVTSAGEIVTAGIGQKYDYEWNFEQSPPDMGEQFDMVFSHFTLEHLINPYKHVEDMKELLKPGGSMIIATALSGFPYHRFPIDAVRFFPDWFEEVADRLSLKVADKAILMLFIIYRFEKPEK